MKRHEALITFSREHHQALILAQLLKKDAPLYKGLPETTEDKAGYAVRFFETDLQLHFDKEEMVFELVKNSHGNINTLIKELLDEHHILRALFASLRQPEDLTDKMNSTGKLLADHIRKEERVLFPLLEKYCSEEQLRQAGRLSEKKPE